MQYRTHTLGYLSSRRGMLEKQLRDCGVEDPDVIAAVLSVPHELFVSTDDAAPPVASVATLAEALRPRPSERVLQVGTGSGYAAAVLSLLAREVFTTDFDAERAEAARERLEAFGYARVVVGGGAPTLGWSAHAPFDAIVVTAAVDAPSAVLRGQLALGGRLVLPVRSHRGVRIVQVVRIGAATFETTELGWLERRLEQVG